MLLLAVVSFGICPTTWWLRMNNRVVHRKSNLFQFTEVVTKMYCIQIVRIIEVCDQNDDRGVVRTTKVDIFAVKD